MSNVNYISVFTFSFLWPWLVLNGKEKTVNPTGQKKMERKCLNICTNYCFNYRKVNWIRLQYLQMWRERERERDSQSEWVKEKERVIEGEREREREWVKEKERVSEGERERERGRGRECVCLWERECVCLWETNRERGRERICSIQYKDNSATIDKMVAVLSSTGQVTLDLFFHDICAYYRTRTR